MSATAEACEHPYGLVVGIRKEPDDSFKIDSVAVKGDEDKAIRDTVDKLLTDEMLVVGTWRKLTLDQVVSLFETIEDRAENVSRRELLVLLRAGISEIIREIVREGEIL